MSALVSSCHWDENKCLTVGPNNINQLEVQMTPVVMCSCFLKVFILIIMLSFWNFDSDGWRVTEEYRDRGDDMQQRTTDWNRTLCRSRTGMTDGYTGLPGACNVLKSEVSSNKVQILCYLT